jgi:3-polyprenyl-4-hydroxybenzoate decarboxylase
MPISPPFYHCPKDLEQMVEQFTDKVLGILGFETQLAWRPEALE